MEIRFVARVGAIACLGVALTMGVIALRDQPTRETGAAASRAAAPSSPLRARLARCQQMGAEGAHDPDCLAAWKENRERFLGVGRQSGNTNEIGER